MNLWNNIKQLLGIKAKEVAIETAEKIVDSEIEKELQNHKKSTYVQVETDFSSMRVLDLRDLAKRSGLKGYTGLKKADLVKLLERELC